MALSKILNASVTDSTLTGAKVASSTITGTNISTATLPNLGRRNLVINGAMQVSQRSTSVTGIGSANGYFTVDRFKLFQAGTAGRLTMSQAAITDLGGFSNAMKFDVTTADASIAAGELFQIGTMFEGQDIQGFKKGHSDAEGFTVSFYVKGTAKTYSVELFDGDNTRHVTQTFSVTTSWNRVVLNFPADTTGKFDSDNALSLYILIWVHAGSTYTGGTAATSWAANNNANRAVGCGSLFSSTDNELFITGLQMEVGSQATSFEHRSFGEEQQLCFRYFFKEPGGNHQLVTGGSAATGDYYDWYPLPTRMRAAPACTVALGSDNFGFSGAAILSRGTTHFVNLRMTKSGTNGASYYTLSAVTADSEL